MKLYPAIISVYQELYSQATLRKNFEFKVRKQDRVLIIKLIKYFNSKYTVSQLTEDLLIQYFEFQFSRYAGVRTPKGKNNIMFNWVTGAKAIKAWQQREIGKRGLIRWRCNSEFRLKLKDAFKTEVTVNHTPFVECVNTAEEQAKQRFHNKPEGYYYCGDFTTLYNPMSRFCNACEFIEECKERLRLNYNKLYKKRLENGTQKVNGEMSTVAI